MPASTKSCSRVGFLFGSLCSEQRMPRRAPFLPWMSTGEAVATRRSMPPQRVTFRKPSSSMAQTIRPISSMCASSTTWGFSGASCLTVQIKLPSGVRRTGPMSFISCSSRSAIGPSSPATPQAWVSFSSKGIISIPFSSFLLFQSFISVLLYKRTGQIARACPRFFRGCRTKKQDRFPALTGKRRTGPWKGSYSAPANWLLYSSA